MANIVDDFSDLQELGIDVSLGDALSVKFDKCVKHVQSIAGSLENDVLLKFYGLYKQSLEGSCNIPKPSWYDLKGKAKWESWNALGNLNQNEAKNKYIELVLSISPDFSFDEAGNKGDSWVKVSSLIQEATPMEKGICDYIRSGDIKQVTDYLRSNCDKNSLDTNGMAIIHYASDIGNSKILELLVKEGCNINLQDSDGQTPLHYAVSCNHLDCIKLLLSAGAKKDIEDSEGFKPMDLAPDDVVKEMLQ